MTKQELKEFLDEKVELYNRPSFIELDPISIPHQFTKKHDIEIAGFLAATISWGNRAMIFSDADRLIEYSDSTQYDFIMNGDEGALRKWKASFAGSLILPI